MTHEEITEKLTAIRPGAHWNLRSPDYAGIEWLDSPDTKPTAAELGL